MIEPVFGRFHEAFPDIVLDVTIDDAVTNQKGDPVKAGELLFNVARDPHPPLHLVLGEDAYERIEKKLASRTDELRRQEAIARSTNY